MDEPSPKRVRVDPEDVYVETCLLAERQDLGMLYDAMLRLVPMERQLLIGGRVYTLAEELTRDDKDRLWRQVRGPPTLSATCDELSRHFRDNPQLLRGRYLERLPQEMQAAILAYVAPERRVQYASRGMMGAYEQAAMQRRARIAPERVATIASILMGALAMFGGELWLGTGTATADAYIRTRGANRAIYRIIATDEDDPSLQPAYLEPFRRTVAEWNVDYDYVPITLAQRYVAEQLAAGRDVGPTLGRGHGLRTAAARGDPLAGALVAQGGGDLLDYDELVSGLGGAPEVAQYVQHYENRAAQVPR